MKKTKTLLIALALGFAANAYAGEPEFPTGKIVAFSPDGGTTWQYYDQQPVDDPYVFTPNAGQTGRIVFNPTVTSVQVANDFKLDGTSFEIETAEGQKVAFTQPLVNYQTSVTLTGKGTIETEGAAAFQNVTVNSGATLVIGNRKVGEETIIGSQIGVVGEFKVNEDAKLVLDNQSTLLLTRQIANDGEIEIKSGAVIDASNVSKDVAVELNIQLEDNTGEQPIHGLIQEVPNGYLYGGEDAGNINISTGNGHVTGSGGVLRIGVIDMDIGAEGVIHNAETQYKMWLQNYGSATISTINDHRSGMGEMSVMLRNGTEENPTILNVDFQVGSGHQVYVARDAIAQINLVDGVDSEGWPLASGIDMLRVYDGANLSITSLVSLMMGVPPDEGRINHAVFVGQGIVVTTIPSPYDDGSLNFSPLHLIVETATSVLMKGDMHPAYGYFQGKPASSSGEQEYDVGDYQLRGILTMAEGFTFDMTASPHESSEKATFAKGTLNDGHTKLLNPVYSEVFPHLTIEENAALLLQEGAKFKANTVLNAAGILDDKGNLDTTRTAASATYTELTVGATISYEANPLYTINGTVVVTGRAQGTSDAPLSSITAKEGAEHYTTRNKGYTIANADITVTDNYDDGLFNPQSGTGDTTISNVLIGDSVTNAKQNNGTVTLDNEKNQNFDTLYADQGDIAITNNTSVNAETVHLGAGREVSVSGTAATPETLLRNGSLTVTDLLQADGNKEHGYSKVGANETTLSSSARLDVSAAGGTGGLELTGALTIQTGATLSSGDIDKIYDMEIGEMYDLAFGVTMFNGSTSESGFSEDKVPFGTPVDASELFGGNQFWKGEYFVCYSATAEGGNGSNVGTVYLYKALPEPTTGTLSLLALAALAARRRRK